MNNQDSPFSALDKRLLSSAQAKQAVPKKEDDTLQRDQSEPRSPLSTDQKTSGQIYDQASDRDTTVSRHHGGTVAQLQEVALDKVRKTVKQLGKEAATHRFTPAEKSMIAEVVFAYRKKGLRTSENEITRIAVNYLMIEFRENGTSSILARILDRLNA